MAATVIKTGGQILDRNSGDVGDADTGYVYFLCSEMATTVKALNWTITATTLTLEFSNDDLAAGLHYNDATAAEMNALNWVDLTTALTGVASHTATGSQTFDEDFRWKFGRVKLLTTNATNACDIYLTRG